MKDLFEEVWNAPKEDIINPVVTVTILGAYVVGVAISIIIIVAIVLYTNWKLNKEIEIRNKSIREGRFGH